MNISKFDINARYNKNKADGIDVLITPESCRILRGMLGLTLQRAADQSSVKRNKLKHFEEQQKPLSQRDSRWLQTMFESAGAEFFIGQGKLHVHLNGEPLIEFGEVHEKLKALPVGTKSTEARFRRSGIADDWACLSQRDVARILGVSQARISAIENNKKGKFF